MNKMKEVAQLLGVELNEEFYIKTLRNKYKFTLNGLETENSATGKWESSLNCFFRDLLVGKLEITHPILDKEEKKYLENVLRPFKQRVDYITKLNPLTSPGKEFLIIFFMDKQTIYFPLFKKGTMYKGMEARKNYTLKELGLFEYE